MKKLMTSTILAASLSMCAGLALANSENDSTNIDNFSTTASQNGQNDRILAGSHDLGDYPTLHAYTGGNH